MEKKSDATTQYDSLLPGLVVGLALGVGIGLLLAPRPGRQTLDMFLERSEALRDRVTEFLDEARAIARVAELKASGFPK